MKRNPRIIFEGDGIIATIVHSESPKGKPPTQKMLLFLPPWARRQASVTEKELDYSHPSPSGGLGLFIGNYETDLMTTLNVNPEFPLIKIKCTLRGDEIDVDSENQEKIKKLTKRIERKDEEIEELHEEMLKLIHFKESVQEHLPERVDERGEPIGMDVIRADVSKNGNREKD